MPRTHHLGLLFLIQVTLGCSATATPKQPALAGSWRLIEQHPVDGKPLRFKR